MNGQVWLGAPTQIGSDPGWPQCVGQSYKVANDPAPHIVADNSGNIWTATTRKGDGYGTRVEIDRQQLRCGSGAMSISPPVAFRVPDPCNPNPFTNICQSGPTGTGTGGPNNGRIIQDEFGVTLSFSMRSGIPVVVSTWNDMRDDPNNTNRRSNIFMMYSENFGAFQTPVHVSRASGGTEYVPWDATGVQDWSDYQGLGTDRLGHFLAVWGADARNANTNGGSAEVWSVFMQ